MSLLQDVRFALRMIRKRPTVSAVVVLTLGFGIGANGILFATFYGSMVRPLPFDQPDRLVSFVQTQAGLGESWSVSAPNFRDWLDGNAVFTDAAAYTWRSYNLQSRGEPAHLQGAEVSAGLFPLLGVEPMLGRSFLADEDQPGGPRVVLISDHVWHHHFAADPEVVGRTLRLDGEVHEIVGVMPEGFRFSHYGQLWTPLQLDVDAQPRDRHALFTVARLRDDVGVEVADAAIGAAVERVASRHPETNSGLGIEVRRLRDVWVPLGSVGRLAGAVQVGLVTCVLLIVCTNVTNVILAQATARRREHALRAALGASRGRLIRQTLVESIVLALGGGVLGATLASWTDTMMQSTISMPMAYWQDLSLDWHGIGYILAVTLAAGLVIGLLPAWRASGPRLTEALGHGGRAEDRGGSWLRRGLVVAEYAVALIVLVAGLLMAKSFHHLESADRGFATDGILTLQLPLTGDPYDDEAARAAFLDQTQLRLDGLGQTVDVGITTSLPIQPGARTVAVAARGFDVAQGQEPRAFFHAVSPGLFDVFELPRLGGRSFHATEVTDGADVAMVSASLAELLWPGDDPLQRQLRILDEGGGPWLDVVGVVGDIEPGQMVPGFDDPTPHRVYLPLAGTATPSAFDSTPRIATLVLEGRGEPLDLVPTVRAELATLDAAVPLFDIRTMRQVVEQFFFLQQFWSRAFSAIAFLALVIAAIGVYGVTTYSVSRRMREMGIRIAMGASPRRLLALVVRRGLALSLVGVGLGLAVAVPLARAMGALLYDMQALDPIVFGAVIGVLLTVGLLASYLPARRAAAADPIIALRDD
ncbi:MAG: ABC transporter permease [Acidobacteriota bacterium]